MKLKTPKILVLTWFVLVLLRPLPSFADLASDVTAWLTERGYGASQASELSVLVPDDGVAFEIANLGRLAKGWNRLELRLTCAGAPYADAEMTVFIDMIPASADTVAETRTAAARPSPGRSPSIVKPGDRVTIMLSSGGLVIRSEGKILRSAGLNQTTDVLNISFNTVVKAVVRDPKTVILK